MKRRTFLKGVFTGLATLPVLPALTAVNEDYSYTLIKLESLYSENKFFSYVRGIATLNSNPNHHCYFAYEVIDDGIGIIEKYDKEHNQNWTMLNTDAYDDIRNHFINKLG